MKWAFSTIASSFTPGLPNVPTDQMGSLPHSRQDQDKIAHLRYLSLTSNGIPQISNSIPRCRHATTTHTIRYHEITPLHVSQAIKILRQRESLIPTPAYLHPPFNPRYLGR